LVLQNGNRKRQKQRGQQIDISKTQKDSDKRGDIRACRSGFELRKLVRSVLESPDFEEALKRTGIAPKKMINPLLCFLFETDEVIRWRAVRGVGITVSAIAEKALEQARTIMRRLIWSLNGESGGIGWGAPEAMGEIMAENETLAREYHRILVSYIDENGNLLENDELERGVMWGIDRLAQKRPELLREWTGPVMAQLNSPDPVKRGLALRTLLFLAARPHPRSPLPSTKLRSRKYQVIPGGALNSVRPHTPSAWRSLEISVALRRRPRARWGLPPTAPGARPRTFVRAPGGAWRSRGKLSPAQFGVILRSLNATWYSVAAEQPSPPQGRLELDRLRPLLVPLLEDQSEIRIFQDGSFAEHKIGRLASELLDRLTTTPEATGD